MTQQKRWDGAVETVVLASGERRYKLHWWDHEGRHRSKTFQRKAHAKRAEREIKELKDRGNLASYDAGQITLSQYWDQWWRVTAERKLSTNGLESYRWAYRRYIGPALGPRKMRDVNAKRVREFIADMSANGVKPQTQRKVLAALQSMCKEAVVDGLWPANPVAQVDKPKLTPPEISPLSPKAVEAIRAKLDPQSAMLVSLMAYGGLRPAEALGLRWRDVGNHLYVQRSAWSDDNMPKTRRRRQVDWLEPLRQDLREWQMACGRPDPEERVIGAWGQSKYDHWQNEVYRPVVQALELGDDTRAYRLRHSFVSLLITAGCTIAYVAQQAGHSQQTCLSVYSHVFAEFDPSERVDPAERIYAARETISDLYYTSASR